MEQILGTISQFAFSFDQQGWDVCHGKTISIMGNQALYSLLGTSYGGDGKMLFNLPDLRVKRAAKLKEDAAYKVGDIMEDGTAYVETYYKQGEIMENGHAFETYYKVGEIMENGLPYIESFICVEGLYPARK